MQQRYYCNDEGEVICFDGWKESIPKDELNPCRVPVCEAPCVNGYCRAPNYCSCKVGW